LKNTVLLADMVISANPFEVMVSKVAIFVLPESNQLLCFSSKQEVVVDFPQFRSAQLN
jgi:hypothetical protein